MTRLEIKALIESAPRWEDWARAVRAVEAAEAGPLAPLTAEPPAETITIAGAPHDPVTVLRNLLDFWQAFEPDVFREIEHPAVKAALALCAVTTTRVPDERVSRWRCPQCGSPRVQIGLPAWHREYGLDGQPGELEYVETDAEADVLWWNCEACGETDGGLPELNDPDNPFVPPQQEQP